MVTDVHKFRRHPVVWRVDQQRVTDDCIRPRLLTYNLYFLGTELELLVHYGRVEKPCYVFYTILHMIFSLVLS